MDVSKLKRVYFLGIGGIGMSALARFFKAQGAIVSGYDRMPTALTNQLIAEGMQIHFTDDVTLIDKEAELFIYTPAIPKDMQERVWLETNQAPLYKRSDALQWITQSLYAITVAGTHGKTTVSTMIAYLLRETGFGCNAFLGGISVNYGSNYWGSPNKVAVVEADEYDRSFLKLFPDVAVLTAMDPDHLDIYGTPRAVEEAFIQYTHNIKPSGTLVVKHGLKQAHELNNTCTISYSLSDTHADVYGYDIENRNGGYKFQIMGKGWAMHDVVLPIGGLHNVENAIAAITVAHLQGISHDSIKQALSGFKGIKRRFEYIINTGDTVYIDDYAHHPEELHALISSAKKLFPHMECVVMFQPHLFSRTNDFATGFAQSLSEADEVILLDIYPARELPMPGVTSELISKQMTTTPVNILSKEDAVQSMKQHKHKLVITAGAGDIDKLIEPIKNILLEA